MKNHLSLTKSLEGNSTQGFSKINGKVLEQKVYKTYNNVSIALHFDTRKSLDENVVDYICMSLNQKNNIVIVFISCKMSNKSTKLGGIFSDSVSQFF